MEPASIAEAGDLIIVIDAGTTGIRAVAVSKTLQRIESSYEAIPERAITRPEPGWVRRNVSLLVALELNVAQVTMDAESLWEITEQVVRTVIAAVGVERVRCISLTTQRASVLLVDEEVNLCLCVVVVLLLLTAIAQGNPVSPFIPWQDSRTGPMCEELNSSASLSLVRGGASCKEGVRCCCCWSMCPQW